MSDRIKFAVSATPLETLTTENSTDKDVIASEVNTSLGGSGDSVSLTNYAQTAANQGYLNGTVSYLDVSHSAGGTRVTNITNGVDFMLVKNTGFKYSSATALGASTTDCIMICIRVDQWRSTVNAGWTTSGDSGQDHFLEIAWLKPGQAVLFPVGANSLSITQFGSNALDLSGFADNLDGDGGVVQIYARTFQSDGSAATDGNALEYLAVT